MLRSLSVLLVDRRRGTLVPMLFGVALFGVSPMVFVPTVDLGNPLGLGGLLSFVAVGIALIAALVGRRTAWTAGLLVALGASVSGVAFQSTMLVAVATPWGDELLPKDLAWELPKGYARILKSEEADLALLHKGKEAAAQGHPLPAPEGGDLVPVRLDSHGPNPYDSALRYGSGDGTDVGAAWRDALRRQQKVVDETRLRATMPMTNSLLAWLRLGFRGVASALGLAILANLAALLSRTFFGEAR